MEKIAPLPPPTPFCKAFRTVSLPSTGKDLQARTIHNLSLNRNAPCVVVNCGASLD